MEEKIKKNRLEIRELTMKNGIAYPTNEELIMLILGSGTKKMPIEKLARTVISTIMSSNSENLVENLIKISGMGKTKALTVAASLELGKRINRHPKTSLENPRELLPFVQNYALESKEHFLCISMNGAREILSIRVVCSGSGNMAIVQPSEVFSQPLKEHASAIVICHNHPNGNPCPSEDDIRTTVKLFLAAETLGISLTDHIIITKTSYFSFLEHGYMDIDKLLNLL